jgi:hypothetical protein
MNLTKQEIADVYGMILGLQRAASSELLKTAEDVRSAMWNHYQMFADLESMVKAREIYHEIYPTIPK